MKVHHLNCATMRPILPRLAVGKAKGELKDCMVCHCLLVEMDAGLVLVDTGFGLDDIADARGRLGSRLMLVGRPVLSESETAIHQVRALGFSGGDVRHIVLTHLDLDHAGGLPDFPGAQVHVYEAEYQAATSRATRLERERYVPQHWAHHPNWVRYETQGEPWFGFECVRSLKGLPPGILLVPLPGHTRGHCGVALDMGDGWLLHAGDAYFHHEEMDLENPHSPFGLGFFQRLVQVDKAARLDNQVRLRELAREHSGEVTMFSAHDAWEFERLSRL